ncbi:HipA domain-containing protein [Bacillus sp. IITD106]|nr:HipA domain-containing protein [Bacillus sp. IITD106]
MLMDVSDWELVGYGGKSTLEKEELLSPDRNKFLIKYPRKFKKGVSWEDITELIAAEIGTIFGMEMMKVQMVTRKGRRGCLLRNFTEEYNAIMAEEGGALLSSLVDGYHELLDTPLKGIELIDFGFNYLNKFPYWSSMKSDFIRLQLFDILIGNQDRHPFNWMLLFFSSDVKFSPVYDNGASLGFRFNDEQLLDLVTDENKMRRYINKTKVKAGIFEKKQVKAVDLLSYIRKNFADEFNESRKLLINFDVERFSAFIQSLDILSSAQKEWLLKVLPFRRKIILDWIGREAD